MEQRDLLKLILDANGGQQNWQQYRQVSAVIRFGGLAFAMKGNRKGLQERTCSVFTKIQKVIFEDYPQKGFSGIYTPEETWIETKHGKKQSFRKNPRNYFGKFPHRLIWDNLDLLYFAGYACWNYFNAPFLLSYEGVKSRELGEWSENGETWQMMEVIFPAHITTHCSEQVFYFDKTYRLRRFDYTPEVFASWAKAAHYCEDFSVQSGFVFPLKRKVFPKTKTGKSLKKPLIVWIDIKEVQLE